MLMEQPVMLASMFMSAASEHLNPHPSLHSAPTYGILLERRCGMHGYRYVQWCHGAPSLIPVLATAAELLEGHASQGPILEAAKKAADVVWERGLLTKAGLKALSPIFNLCNKSCFCSAGSVPPQVSPGKTWVGVCRRSCILC